MRARNTFNYLVLDPEGHFFVAANFLKLIKLTLGFQ